MSKRNNNFLKNKIELIAKSLIKKNEAIKSNYLNAKNFREKEKESKQNNLNLSINTLKDSLSFLEEYKDSFCKDITIKKNQTTYYRNNLNMNLYKPNNYSSFCTKGTSCSDNLTNKNVINDSYKEDKIKNENKKINSLFKTKEENGKNNRNDNNKIIKIYLNRINIEQIKELKIIYEKMIKIFNDANCLKMKENKNSKDNNDNEMNANDYINKCQILSFHCIKILLSQNFEYISKLFYDSIEINKFILYETYLFLSLIYLKEDKLKEYLLLSYKTILFYSSKNIENVIKIIMNFKLYNDIKINLKIKQLNKIIISILKTLTDIPSNRQILLYITPSDNNIETNINNFEIEDIIKKRTSGISNLLMLLKENKDLNEKMLEIEKNEVKLVELYNNMDNYEIEEDISKKEEKIIQKEEFENILPDFDNKKYKYSVVIELDETLVHYYEENNNYFVKVRFGCENFIRYISNFCEIIIVSTSGIEYSEIIIDNLKKTYCPINHRIYSENYKDLDLSKINRDMNKTFFICHEENFLNAPKSNIIKLKEFDGDEQDKELEKLYQEFKKMEEGLKKEDIKHIIQEIQNDIKKEVIEEE